MFLRAGTKGEWELYDIEKDRTESFNLASQHLEKVSEPENIWNDWAIKTNVLPKPNIK